MFIEPDVEDSLPIFRLPVTGPIMPSGSVYLIALARILPTHWTRRAVSASTRSGAVLSVVTVKGQKSRSLAGKSRHHCHALLRRRHGSDWMNRGSTKSVLLVVVGC